MLENSYPIRTDLALESQERLQEDQADMRGIRVLEERRENACGVRAIDAKRLPTVRNGMLSMWRFVRFVLGYRRSQKRHPQRVAVETSADRCTHCGRCVKLCPTGAIVAGDELRTDAAKCIRCCACVKGCPVGARSYDSPFAPVLSRNFAQRKRNLTLM